jgi:uncharacterized glyoxalase superfamily protein PhnB
MTHDHGHDHDHVAVQPIFPVAAIEPAIAFYRRLGFEVVQYDEDYAWVTWEGHEIVHLRHVPDLEVAANAASCYVHVEDVDGWHARWSTASGVEVAELADQPWGMREFSVTDPSGNLVRVGTPSTAAEPAGPL